MSMWAWEWWQAWPAACLHYLRGLNFPMCFFTDSHASLKRLILTHIMVAGQRPSPVSTICLPDHCFAFQSGLRGFAFCSFLCNISFFVCFNLGYMASLFFLLLLCNSSILLLRYFESWLSFTAARSCWSIWSVALAQESKFGSSALARISSPIWVRLFGKVTFTLVTPQWSLLREAWQGDCPGTKHTLNATPT